MKSCRVYTESGHSWTTSINGTNESIKKYFMGKQFNVASYPHENIETVHRVEILKNYVIEGQESGNTYEVTEESPHTAMLALVPIRAGSVSEPFHLFKLLGEVFYYNTRGTDCQGNYINDVLILKLIN